MQEAIELYSVRSTSLGQALTSAASYKFVQAKISKYITLTENPSERNI